MGFKTTFDKVPLRALFTSDGFSYEKKSNSSAITVATTETRGGAIEKFKPRAVVFRIL